MRNYLNSTNFLKIASIVGGAAMLAAAASQASASVNAYDYSAFVFNNMTYSSDSQGPIAVGNDATFADGFSIPAPPTGSGEPANSLVVGHDFTDNGSSIGGSVIVGNTAKYTDPTIGGSLTANNVDLPANGGTVSGGIYYYNTFTNGTTYLTGTKLSGTLALPIDFAAAQTALKAQSTNLASLVANGTTEEQYSTLTLTGSSKTLDVFNVSASLLGPGHETGITFVNDAGSGSTPTVIINITGTSASLSGGISGFNSATTLWNFSQAASIGASGIGITGTVLAPLATFNFTSGQITGGIIADNLSGSGQLNNPLFTGNLPNPGTTLPEPTSLGLLSIAGLGILLLPRKKSLRA